MAFYSGAALAQLVSLIKKDNPTVEGLTPETIMLLSGPLTTELGNSGRNTRIRINGVVGDGFIGKQDVYYDRIDLSKYITTLPALYALPIPGDAITYADLLPVVNAVFGLGLTAADIKTPTKTLPTAYTATTLTYEVDTANSIIHVGKLVFNAKRVPAGMYADSGPGNKQMLAGTAECGYFGVVAAAEVFSAIDFFNQVTEGQLRGSALAVKNPSLYYLKYAIDGKYVFFPSTALVSGMTWENIYKLGGIDASGVDAAFPPASGSGVFQNALVENATSIFKVRLPKMSGVDPAPLALGAAGSEVERLFKKVHAGTGGTGEWDALVVGAGNLDIATSFIYQNSVSGTTTSAVSGSLNLATLVALVKTTAGNWRPLLEYVDPATTLLATKLKSYAVEDYPKAIVMDAKDTAVHLTAPIIDNVNLDEVAAAINWASADGPHFVAPVDVWVNIDNLNMQPINWAYNYG